MVLYSICQCFQDNMGGNISDHSNDTLQETTNDSEQLEGLECLSGTFDDSLPSPDKQKIEIKQLSRLRVQVPVTNSTERHKSELENKSDTESGTDSEFEENNFLLIERSVMFNEKCQSDECNHKVYPENVVSKTSPVNVESSRPKSPEKNETVIIEDEDEEDHNYTFKQSTPFISSKTEHGDWIFIDVEA